MVTTVPGTIERSGSEESTHAVPTSTGDSAAGRMEAQPEKMTAATTLAAARRAMHVILVTDSGRLVA